MGGTFEVRHWRVWALKVFLVSMSSWLFSKKSGGGSEQASVPNGPPRDVKEARAQAEKLKGYHDLSKVMPLACLPVHLFNSNRHPNAVTAPPACPQRLDNTVSSLLVYVGRDQHKGFSRTGDPDWANC